MDDEFDEWQEAPAQPTSQPLQIEHPQQIIQNKGYIQQSEVKVQDQNQKIEEKSQFGREKQLKQKLYINESIKADTNYDDLLEYKSQPILIFQNFHSNNTSKQTVNLQQGENPNSNPYFQKEVHIVQSCVQKKNVQPNVNFHVHEEKNQETQQWQQSSISPNIYPPPNSSSLQEANHITQNNNQSPGTKENDEDQFGQFQEPTSVLTNPHSQIANSKVLSHLESEAHDREKQKQKEQEKEKVRKIKQKQNEKIQAEGNLHSQMNTSGVFNKPKIKKPVYSQVQQKKATEIIKKIPDYSFINKANFIE